jgi:hypothetical protein
MRDSLCGDVRLVVRKPYTSNRLLRAGSEVVRERRDLAWVLSTTVSFNSDKEHTNSLG